MSQLLIIGCGDVARRALPSLVTRYRVHALVRNAGDRDALERAGVVPIVGDLDQPPSLARLAALGGRFDCVAHLAPPPDHGTIDPRTRHLIEALARPAMVAQPPRPPGRLVYVSTSGVYGDCSGACVDEARPVNPGTDRARRRVDAETSLLEWGRAAGVCVSILRVPGIYAAERLPLDRLRRGTPVLRAEDDVYTNHIHAEDLARILVAALERGGDGEIYNATDDGALKMGEWFDLVADRAGLARPPRIARSDAPGRIPPVLLSFMSESRRLLNAKMKRSLGIVLRYPTVREGVPHGIVGC